MAYGQSHKIEYKDYKDVDNLIEIWEDGYEGEVQECEAGEDPLNIDIAAASPYIFVPVIGTGATIGLNSATGGQYLNLFTLNPVKRMVKIFKNNSEVPWWLGYVNPEQYGEGYSRAQDYPVVINCNDGINVLNRFKYVDGSGDNYTTLESKWTILTRIITKMGLPFQYLYFASKLSSDGVTVESDETIFHQLKADQNNYNNEQDEPMTFREVLEALLTPYGLQIRWMNGSIIVYEPQMLADASFSAKKYDSDFAYVSTDTLNLNFDISDEEINWDNEDQHRDTITGSSKQPIRFSPYGYDHAIPFADLTDPMHWTGEAVWTETHMPTGGASIYYLSGVTAVAGFTLAEGLATLTGKRTDLLTDPDIYIEGAYSGDGDLFLENKTAHRYLSGVMGSSILFKGKIFLRTKEWENLENSSRDVVRSIIFKIAVEVDGKRPVAPSPRDDYEWIVSTTDFFYIKVHDSGNFIDNRWIDFKFQVPWNFPSGELVIKVYDDFKCYDDVTKWIEDTPLNLVGGVYNMRFKDLEYSIIDVKDPADGGRIGMTYSDAALDDKNYTGKINEEFLNEGSEITLVHADSLGCSDRGAIRKADGSFTTGWKKTGETESNLLVEILLRSIISQYQASLNQLSGTLEADSLMASNGGPDFLFTLQDTDYLPGVRHLFTGGTYNDFKRTLNGSFLEVKQEDLTIEAI